MRVQWAIPVLASILILGNIGLSQQAFAEIPSGFSDFGGHCYGEAVASTWAATQAEAVSLGGHLVTINDADENAFVFSISGGGPWIGYNDIAVEGTFEWVSGIVTGGYENWAGGEPSGDSDVVHMQGDGTWNDFPDTGVVTSGMMELPFTCAAAFGVVGGTILPIDTTALLVAGAQTISPWLILGVIIPVGIGLAVFSLKRSR